MVINDKTKLYHLKLNDKASISEFLEEEVRQLMVDLITFMSHHCDSVFHESFGKFSSVLGVHSPEKHSLYKLTKKSFADYLLYMKSKKTETHKKIGSSVMKQYGSNAKTGSTLPSTGSTLPSTGPSKVTGSSVLRPQGRDSTFVTSIDQRCQFENCTMLIDERCWSCGGRYCGFHLVILNGIMNGHRTKNGIHVSTFNFKFSLHSTIGNTVVCSKAASDLLYNADAKYYFASCIVNSCEENFRSECASCKKNVCGTHRDPKDHNCMARTIPANGTSIMPINFYGSVLCIVDSPFINRNSLHRTGQSAVQDNGHHDSQQNDNRGTASKTQKATSRGRKIADSIAKASRKVLTETRKQSQQPTTKRKQQSSGVPGGRPKRVAVKEAIRESEFTEDEYRNFPGNNQQEEE